MLKANHMSKFEHISVKGFRRLQDIDLEMRDLMVKIQQKFDPRGLLSCDRL